MRRVTIANHKLLIPKTIICHHLQKFSYWLGKFDFDRITGKEHPGGQSTKNSASGFEHSS